MLFRIVYDIGKNSCYAFIENCCRFHGSVGFLIVLCKLQGVVLGEGTIHGSDCFLFMRNTF